VLWPWAVSCSNSHAAGHVVTSKGLFELTMVALGLFLGSDVP
jgi:hypothetical protein